MSEVRSKSNFLKDISANTLQTVITQLFGLLIFYVTSKYLPKNDFGEFNWSIAVGFTAISVASLGLDLVLVKRIASNLNVLEVSGIHFFHTIIVGLVLGFIALLLQTLVPAFHNSHPFFLGVFVNILIINIANSFKLTLNGLDAYKYLAIIAFCSNAFKFTLIVVLFLLSHFSITNIILVYLATSVLEFFCGYFLLRKRLSMGIKPLYRITEYKAFVMESLPQLGVVIFDSALSRMDVILLGILSTATITAEYSFVYKVYELSKLPILIIGPILLTRFSRLFASNLPISPLNQSNIRYLVKLELFLIMFIPIVLISTWSPLVDYFTNNKYGQVNEVNYWLLALCVPLVGIVNFLWTLGFVQGQLKTIMYITFVVSLLNVLFNLVLIPSFGSFGSAMAFLACSLIQVMLYMRYINQNQLRFYVKDGLALFLTAFTAVITAKLLTNNIIFTALASVAGYVGLTILTRQISIKEISEILKKR